MFTGWPFTFLRVVLLSSPLTFSLMLLTIVKYRQSDESFYLCIFLFTTALTPFNLVSIWQQSWHFTTTTIPFVLPSDRFKIFISKNFIWILVQREGMSVLILPPERTISFDSIRPFIWVDTRVISVTSWVIKIGNHRFSQVK